MILVVDVLYTLALFLQIGITQDYILSLPPLNRTFYTAAMLAATEGMTDDTDLSINQ